MRNADGPEAAPPLSLVSDVPRRLTGAAALLAAGALLLGGCAPRAGAAGPSPGNLAATIDRIVDEPPLDGTHWGILFRDAETGRVLYERNGGRHFIPASNTKLVVTTVALGVLGPDWRYRTPVVAVRAPGDSVAAQLRVAGSGDPTLSARFHEDELSALDSLARAVRAAGVTRVQGDVVVEADAFTDATVHSSWEIGDLPWYYAAPTGAFAVAEGTFRLVVEPGAAPGYPGSAHVLGGALVDLDAVITTDTAGAPSRRSIDYTARRAVLHLTGSIAVDAGADTVTLAVTRPAEHGARAFRAALERAGVVVEGGAVAGPADTLLHVLTGAVRLDTVTVHQSPPLIEIVAGILQPSQNWIAEQLLKTLGSLADSTGVVDPGADPAEGSWNRGVAVEERYLTEVVGIDSLAFNLRDASGLSAQNLLTPRAVVALLEHAHARWGSAWEAALAGPGVRGSTLNSRLTDHEGRVFAKTGTISNVSALSGHLVTVTGRRLTFSILANGTALPSGPIREAIDAVVEAAAREAGR